MGMLQTWREISIPARKTEYEGKHLLLLANPERYEAPRQFWPDGYYGNPDLTDTVVRLTRRCNAKDTQSSSVDVSHWGAIRVMRVQWRCCFCNVSHDCYIPESWLEEGKAVFVEKVTSTDKEQ
jgi:broad specificity phosphatase PhoE